MEYGIAKSYMIMLQMSLILFVMFPGVFISAWQKINKQFTVRWEKLLTGRNRKSEERLKSYWEIDMRNLK